MLRLLWKLCWKLAGWKVAGRFPYEQKKMVLIVAPHTSSKDVIIGFCARAVLNIHHAKFLGKKELFDGMFGWFFRMLGGVPVDRFSKQGMVEQVAEMFASNNNFLLAMAPEGTRQRVDKLRTGFYHIAKAANVPVLCVGLNFAKKELVLGPLIFPTDNEEKDFGTILDFFATIEGANPDRDLRHLRLRR